MVTSTEEKLRLILSPAGGNGPVERIYFPGILWKKGMNGK
jgi:hypothetical protein